MVIDKASTILWYIFVMWSAEYHQIMRYPTISHDGGFLCFFNRAFSPLESSFFLKLCYDFLAQIIFIKMTKLKKVYIQSKVLMNICVKLILYGPGILSEI